MNNINNKELKLDLIKVLSSNLLYLNITLIINAIVIALAFRNISEQKILITWILLFMAITIFDFIMRKKFNNNPYRYSVETYSMIFELPVYLSNIIFSVGIVAIFPDNLPFYQTFLSMTIASIASVAVMSLSSNRTLIINYLIILILPLISMFSFESNYVSSLIVLLYSLFLVILIVFSKKYNDNIVNLILSKIEIKNAKKEILQSKNDFSIIFEKAPIGILTYNTNYLVNKSNEVFAKFLKLKQSQLSGLNLKKHLSPILLSVLQKVKDNHNDEYEGEYYHPVLKKIVWINLRVAPTYNLEQKISGGMAIVTDITKRIEDEKEINRKASCDDLTSITNRVTFNERLEGQLSFLQAQKRFGSILFIDLDNFKNINDSLGHHIGDEILKEFALRVKKLLQREDTFARFGGDEFVIMVPDISKSMDKTTAKTSEYSDRLHEISKEPFLVENNILQLTLSIGITIIGYENNDKTDIIKQADIAMYEAKQDGRNCSKFFVKSMQDKVEEELNLTNELHNAIKNNEFVIHYQPIVNLKNNIIESCEALIRWNHPTRGLVHPNDFIPFAEKHGLLVPIGYQIIENVFSQYNKWNKLQNTSLNDIALNVSAKQFNELSFIKNVKQLILKYDINPRHIKIELTESVVINNINATIKKINDLKELGFVFSMDDFGTGYSSLSYLKNLPFDYLKIDQSFIKNVLSDKNDTTLVKSIIAISEQFGFSVIAEGVETQEQVEFLRSINCNYYQGFIKSKAISAKNFYLLIENKTES